MLEKMAEFFEKRSDDYDEHMKRDIESANEFYAFTAQLLPNLDNCSILDLGCGTGLELEEYYLLNPGAKITGIDLSQKMLNILKEKFKDRNFNSLKLIGGSYFNISFGENIYDAAVSVESLHHFVIEEKIYLYTKVHKSLKSDGYFILTDYFSLSVNEELAHQENLKALKSQQGIVDDELYHYDIPLSVDHEREALLKAGFRSVDLLKNWGATHTIKAMK